MEQMLTDEFIAEAIGIVAIRKLHIDIAPVRDEFFTVHVEFEGHSVDGVHFQTVQHGRTIGEALRLVREQMRVEMGQ